MNRNVTALILIVLAIGIYVTFTRAKLAEVNEVRAVNDQYILALANADELIKTRDSVLTDYNNLAAKDRERLDKMLPNTVDNIRLIIDLNDVALNHGVSLHNIKAVASSNSRPQGAPSIQAMNGANTVGGSIPTPILDTVTVSFSMTMPYQQGIDFLRDLEVDLRIMDVTHISVAASATQGGVYDFGVDLKTYWLRQQ